jgi:uncharacterized protein (DUF1810 family)
MTGGQYDLDRFVNAQQEVYGRVLRELATGRKQSHWMWFMFPQLRGLGMSEASDFYGISGLDEARAYLAHPELGSRLVEMCEVLCALEGMSAHEVFDTPDDLKLRSCATLFAQVSDAGSVFHRILDKYYDGEPDPLTMKRLNRTGD